MLDGTHCPGAYEEGSQLAQAVEFLHAHARTTRLVTVTLGSNDITPCLAKADVNGCAQERLAVIYRNMEVILGELHSTAPQVPIVVTNYYNPYLALYFDPSRRALVPLTTALQAQLNATLAAATAGEGEVADVATAFRSYDSTLAAQGLPVNVATICVYTWMCSWSPSNIHATSLGYDAMAHAVIERR
jgi:lysophospholipase L1-like esterase